jgi:cell division protein FtsN
MSDKASLILFSKKEIALIFTFILVLFIVSYLFGVMVGKNYTEQLCDITPSDKEIVELMSEDDELVEALEEESDVDKINSENRLLRDSYGQLQAEFDKLAAEESAETSKNDKVLASEVKDPMLKPQEVKYKDEFTGKYTIQLGSHATLADAEKFADAFKVRGYDVIINEADIKGKGVWFRVNLGVFDTIKDAKDYIEKEKSLFQNTDYLIGRFN